VEAAESSQLSLWCYKTKRRHISKSSGFYIHCCNTLISHQLLTLFLTILAFIWLLVGIMSLLL